MTDPTEKTFLSYRRSQADIAETLVTALQEHGIPVWQDISDLKTRPTQTELKNVLRSSEINSGIVLVSEDVVESEIILELELPELMDRWQDKEEFSVVVALCPGVDYDDGSDILSASPTPHDFSTWNMDKLKSDVESPKMAADIVEDILQARVRLAHEILPDDQPLYCSLDTYRPPSHDPKPTVAIDWSPHFETGFPSPTVWDERLVPSLSTVTDIIERVAPGRSLQFRGQAHLPATFALGHILRATRGIRTSWMQEDPYGGAPEEWHLGIDEEPIKVVSNFEEKDVIGSDLAVCVSLTNEVNAAVGRSKSTLPEFNGMLELSLEDKPGATITPSQAVYITNVFREKVQKAINELSATSTIHLFMAVPAGLSFLFGQQSNTFPGIQTYILETTDQGRIYCPAALIQ